MDPATLIGMAQTWLRLRENKRQQTGPMRLGDLRSSKLDRTVSILSGALLGTSIASSRASLSGREPQRIADTGIIRSAPTRRSERRAGTAQRSRIGWWDLTAWLGMSDSNSEMSSQIIPLKRRSDFRESGGILALGDRSRLSCGVEDMQLGPSAKAATMPARTIAETYFTLSAPHLKAC
jgi:hypothetical protein